MCGAELIPHQFLVLDDADLGRSELVQTRRETVADEFERVGGVFGKLRYLQADGAQSHDSGLHAPCRPPAPPCFQKGVDLLQLAGEELIVMTELQKLRVSVFQDTDGASHSALRVV